MLERPRAKTLRCAIYTRKSSEEGLEQDFNSLQAQREACEAYIASQKHEGWKALSTAFDDGAYSGGTIDRPALQRLLADIAAGKVDVVVVYKVDRLTRSLADFAKIVEIFDRHGVSFVSVTQQFNTTTSMGRLTLNVLLSFAQFEREVTGERIRDKIAASKKKGLWMGGFVPLGYRANQRTLVIHEAEAKIVRIIFNLYRQLGSVPKLEAELRKRGINRPPSTTMASKRIYGARAFMRGEIYKLLENPIYIGEIHHKGHRYEGQHPPIIGRKVWNAVRAKLAANAHDWRVGRGTTEPSLLAGLLYDDQGNRLTPTHTIKNGKRYRYYGVPRRPGQKHERDEAQTLPRWRIPSGEIETIVIAQLARQLTDPRWLLKHAAARATIGHRKAVIAKGKNLAGQLRSLTGPGLRALLLTLVSRVMLADSYVKIEASRAGIIKTVAGAESLSRRDSGNGKHFEASAQMSVGPRRAETDDVIRIQVPIALARRGLETKLILNVPGGGQEPEPDPILIKLIANAHQWWDDLVAGRYPTTRALAQAYGKDERYVARALPLAFLSPATVDAIVMGKQPVDLTTQRLMTLSDLPSCWNRQVEVLGFDNN